MDEFDIVITAEKVYCPHGVRGIPVVEETWSKAEALYTDGTTRLLNLDDPVDLAAYERVVALDETETSVRSWQPLKEFAEGNPGMERFMEHTRVVSDR
jgi:hypothetical protein